MYACPSPPPKLGMQSWAPNRQMLAFSTGEIRLWAMRVEAGPSLTCPFQSFRVDLKLWVDCSWQRNMAPFPGAQHATCSKSMMGPDGLRPPFPALFSMWNPRVRESHSTSLWPIQGEQGRRQKSRDSRLPYLGKMYL